MSEEQQKRILGIFVNNHYDPERITPPHFHVDIEIMIIRSGRGRMNCGEAQLEVESGDVLLFRSMEPHYIFEVTSRYPLKYLSFSFSKDILMKEKEGWVDKSLLAIVEDKSIHFQNKLVLERECRNRIKKLAAEVEQELQNEELQNSYIIKCKFLEIISRISFGYPVLSDQSLGGVYYKNITQSIIYMNHHIADPLTLEDLANAARMGVSHYSATFKKIMGVSPWSYFVELRVNLAIEYLTECDTDYKITAISSMCGFNNTVNFNKAFKRVTGKSPSEYRARNR